MKKLILLIVILILSISQLSFAKTYTFSKKCNPSQLSDELDIALGGIFTSNPQQAYMNTKGGSGIAIIVKDGVVIDEQKLEQTIKTHNPKTDEQIKEEKKQKRIKDLKDTGFTQQQADAIYNSGVKLQ